MKNTQNIYDNQTFFDGYKKLRSNCFSANNIEEKPALFSLSPELTGKSVLDLGCGFGENCARFNEFGADRVIGIDISEKMLAVAKDEYPKIEFIRADMVDLTFLKEKFDVVFSSLAVHYIEEFNSFIKSVYDILNPGGYFIFSQEHPLTTAPIQGNCWTKDNDGNILHYNLTDYLRCGKRVTTWIVDGVEKYHRTFSEIVNALCSAGFTIEKMIEPEPTKEAIEYDSKYKILS